MRPFARPALLVGAGLLAAPPARSRGSPARTGSPTDDPAYYFMLGRHLEGEGKVDEAIAAHKQAIALAPDSAELRAELAGLYARNDRAIEALDTARGRARDTIRTTRKPTGSSASIYAALAEQRQPLRAGRQSGGLRAKRAIAALEKARGATALRHQPRPDARPALRADRRVRQGAPAAPARRRRSARVSGRRRSCSRPRRRGAGRPDDAIETLEETLGVNPNFYRGQLRLAELYERSEALGRRGGRVTGGRRQLNPRTPRSSPRRAVALINAGKAAEARDILRAARGAAKPDAPDAALAVPPRRGAARRSRICRAAEATARKLLASAPGRRARPSRAVARSSRSKGDVKARRSERSAISSRAIR